MNDHQEGFPPLSTLFPLFLLLSLTPLLRAKDADGPAKRSPDEVLLVYNQNSPISKSVADDYAEKRKVKNVISIQCADSALKADDETIPLSDYTRAIEKPIRGYLAAHEGIQFIVLIKGVPSFPAICFCSDGSLEAKGPLMPEPSFCPSCGSALRGGTPRGLCPRCLMKRGMEARSAGFTESGPAAKSWEPPAPAELAGQLVGLEVIALVGRGGMGAVYKARQKHLDRIVALKILPPDIGNDPAFADRFAREAKALARLNHPNVVTLYEFGRTTAGLYYFLMEYVDGVNLRRLMDGARVAPREALAIVPQVCDALQYAHDQGIVHRDIKPENILLDRLGRVKVADFGLAKITGHDDSAAGDAAAAGAAALTEAGKVVGTPHYMAPEQAVSPGNVDHRADIYALGVVFYQMLTGELPGRPVEAPSRKIQVDVRLDEVVLRALERDPGLRYAQASVMKTQVEAIARSSDPAPETTRSTATSGSGPTRQARHVFSLRRLPIICFAAAFIFPAGALLLARFAPVKYSVTSRLQVFATSGGMQQPSMAGLSHILDLPAADPGASVVLDRDVMTVSITDRSPDTLADRADSLTAKIAAAMRKEPGTSVEFLESAHPPIHVSSPKASFLLAGLLCSLLSCIAGVFLMFLAWPRVRHRPNGNPVRRDPKTSAGSLPDRMAATGRSRFSSTAVILFVLGGLSLGSLGVYAVMHSRGRPEQPFVGSFVVDLPKLRSASMNDPTPAAINGAPTKLSPQELEDAINVEAALWHSFALDIEPEGSFHASLAFGEVKGTWVLDGQRLVATPTEVQSSGPGALTAPPFSIIRGEGAMRLVSDDSGRSMPLTRVAQPAAH